jgi:hypothetical protein
LKLTHPDREDFSFVWLVAPQMQIIWKHPAKALFVFGLAHDNSP